MHKTELQHQLGLAARKSMEARQIARRLRALLPGRLAMIAKRVRGPYSAMKSSRLALQDSAYLAYLEELVEVSSQAREQRIYWETRTMLLKARQSIQAFHRP